MPFASRLRADRCLLPPVAPELYVPFQQAPIETFGPLGLFLIIKAPFYHVTKTGTASIFPARLSGGDHITSGYRSPCLQLPVSSLLNLGSQFIGFGPIHPGWSAENDQLNDDTLGGCQAGRG